MMEMREGTSMAINGVLAAVAILAVIVAWLFRRAKYPQLIAMLAAKDAELDAKNTLINHLQESARALPELKAAAERVPMLSEEIRSLRFERDGHLVKVAEHKTLTEQLSDAQLKLATALEAGVGLHKLIAAKDETVRESNEKAAGTVGERDQLRAELHESKTTKSAMQLRLTELTADLEGAKAQLDAEKKLFEEKSKLLTHAETTLRDAFGSLSNDALRRNNEAFLDLARQSFERLKGDAQLDLEAREKSISALVEPVRQSLQNFDQQLRELENTRTAAYSSLTTQVKGLAESQDFLRKETGNLVKALRAPQVRGRWGELTLRRVVEMAGMLDHCDFVEQESTETESGNQRPDMIVRMPGNRKIIVDAKVPLNAYLDALEIQDEDARKLKLADHARQLRDHVTKLSRKSYWEQYRNETPEFVVLFIPGEVFYSAALEFDPSLIEQAANDKVMLASPANLIPLLRAVHYGWKQEAIAANATQVSDLGRELYDRIAKLAEHWSNVGRQLNGAMNAYNASVGALESRVLVSARKFQQLRVTLDNKEISPPVPIEVTARSLTAQELTIDASAGKPVM
jgi:DNA recombination protein RmuC